MLSFFYDYFVAFLVICNPAIAIPVLVSLTKGKSIQEKRKVALTAALGVGIILITMIWCGGTILEVLSVRVGAFQITGGLILLLLGISMVNPSGKDTSKESAGMSSKASVAIIPLAMPVMAGPGAISVAIVASTENPLICQRLTLTASAIGVAVVAAIILYNATRIEKWLGDAGMGLMARLGGLVLAALAVETMSKGITSLFLQ